MADWENNMLLSDYEIARLCSYTEERPLLDPYVKSIAQDGVAVSYGPSSYGYDIRLGLSFARFLPSLEPLDPRKVTDADVAWETVEEGVPYVIPPRGFILAKAVEYFRMPRDVTGFVHDKSTYARCGIHVQNTVIEAGWEGDLTLEISNYIDRPVLLRPGQGIAQVTFMRGEPCTTSYEDRGGKYQGQKGVTLPRAR